MFEVLKSDLKEMLSVALEDLPRNSTPGFPWMVVGSVNKQLLDSPLLREQLLDEALNRMGLIMSRGEDYFRTSSPDVLVREGLCDPVRLFIKQEPHKRSKLDLGKYRLISGLSIVDQLIDRVLFGPQNKLEILLWNKIPSKPGIGLDDEGLRKMATWFEKILGEGRTLLSTDISGWDWSVQEWELIEDFRCRELLCNGSGSLWSHLAWARVTCVSKKLFVLPDSTLVAQSIPGIQASGSYNTSSTNSRMRILARTVAYRLVYGEVREDEVGRVVAMGDDCVEAGLDRQVYETITKLGHTVKDLVEFNSLEGVEFCSHRWYADGLARPVNWVKTLFRFAQQPDNPQLLPGLAEQLVGDMRNMRGVGDLQIREVIGAKLQAPKYTE